MNKTFKDFLFSKRILVNDTSVGTLTDFERTLVMMKLAIDYGYLIKKGEELVDKYILGYVKEKVDGVNVPPAFYKGFPASVRLLTSEEKLLDQLVHYINTYGLGNFDEAGHSIFEQEIERTVLTEKHDPIQFVVLSEEDAVIELTTIVRDMLANTRPLNNTQCEVIREFYAFMPDVLMAIPIASKATAIELLVTTRDIRFSSNISLSDVPKVVEKICYDNSGKANLKKLNLCNKDRKFISKLLDYFFISDRCHANDIAACSERKKIWCGLLHHIHYTAKNDAAIRFLNVMRGNKNVSNLSKIENFMRDGLVVQAAQMAVNTKGSSYVLRNLNYFLSRCNCSDEVEGVIKCLDTSCSTIALMQLYYNYLTYSGSNSARVFSFVKNGLMKTHVETDEECNRRKSVVLEPIRKYACAVLKDLICESLKNKLGKVYLDPDMSKLAIPLYAATGESGLGILSTGSRLPINSYNIRAFTYWENVDDIDLSCIVVNEDGSQDEFSWRTIHSKTSEAITFSGDQTSGFYGGSEFFDVDINLLKKQNPNAKYIVFCNNVFSGVAFKDCICRAGYMLREDLDAGQIYEPKTVKSSYNITADSTFAYLFAIDLDTNELVWLNQSVNKHVCVAGTQRMDYLNKYLELANVLNYEFLFKAMASELVDNIEDADVVVSDSYNGEKSVIRSYDLEKVAALI